MIKLSKKILLLLFINNIIQVTTANQEPEECIGKHQIPITNLFDFQITGEIREAINLKNFNVTPEETILKNNDYTLVLSMKYKDDSVPTVDFGSTSGLSNLRFEFLYFQWYENATETIFPVELHAVFYHSRMKNFQNALNRKNSVVVLAFGTENKIVPNSEHSFLLKRNIQSVRNGIRRVTIENRPLNVWIPVLMNEYTLYEGHLPFFNCVSEVLWVDFVLPIPFGPELKNEFELLQTHEGQSLMKQYRPFRAPQGPLVQNFGRIAPGDAGTMGGIPFVDAYYDDDDGDDKLIYVSKAFQGFKDITKFQVFIFILGFYFIF